jgi:serine/threonine protein kinase
LIKREVNLLRIFDNPYILKFIDFFETVNNIYIITEYCNGGDLQQVLDSKKSLTERQIKVIMKQLVKGFHDMHKVSVIHRDFKMANTLLHFKGRDKVKDPVSLFAELVETDPTQIYFKIADLGLARQLKNNELASTNTGSPLFMAPDILFGKKYGMKVDVWSFGIVFYNLLTGVNPFMSQSMN